MRDWPKKQPTDDSHDDTVAIMVRMTRFEREQIQDAAHEARVSMNQWCRKLLVEAAIPESSDT